MDTITALMIAPNMHPCLIELHKNVDFLRLAVNIGIDAHGSMGVLRLSDTAGILYNEDAPLYDYIGNRRVGKLLIAGVFYVVGIKDGNITSLSKTDAEKYMATFWEPEKHSAFEAMNRYVDNLTADIDKFTIPTDA